MSIGVLGEYVARIYEESKGRPLYIVAGSANMNENDNDIRKLNDVLLHDQSAPTRVYHPTAAR
jgi:hypothetical protein